LVLVPLDPFTTNDLARCAMAHVNYRWVSQPARARCANLWAASELLVLVKLVRYITSHCVNSAKAEDTRLCPLATPLTLQILTLPLQILTLLLLTLLLQILTLLRLNLTLLLILLNLTLLPLPLPVVSTSPLGLVASVFPSDPLWHPLLPCPHTVLFQSSKLDRLLCTPYTGTRTTAQPPFRVPLLIHLKEIFPQKQRMERAGIRMEEKSTAQTTFLG